MTNDQKILEAARKSLFGIEMARTHLVQPVNGSHDYFYVSFAGARIEFRLHCDDDPDAIRGPLGVEVAELSAKASACATAINDLLFKVAKDAARAAAPE